jgi:hypothetical protein
MPERFNKDVEFIKEEKNYSMRRLGAVLFSKYADDLRNGKADDYFPYLIEYGLVEIVEKCNPRRHKPINK